jgi:hypothetical protein
MSYCPKVGDVLTNLTINYQNNMVDIETLKGKWIVLHNQPNTCTRLPNPRTYQKFQAHNIEVATLSNDANLDYIIVVDPELVIKGIFYNYSRGPLTQSAVLKAIRSLDSFKTQIEESPKTNEVRATNCPNLERIVGEYVLGSPTNVDSNLLDFVIYAFALIQPDGTLQVYSERHLKELANMRIYKPELKVILGIGGWGADGFSDAALTPTSRFAFAREVQKWVKQYNLDGVDIDWEYPGSSASGIKSRPQDKENFTLLLEALRTVLGNNAWISVAGTGDNGYIKNVDIAGISKHINYFNLMSYDFTAGETGERGNKHQANLYPSDLALNNLSVAGYIENLEKAGMPSEKILMGLPFYGRRGSSFTKTFDQIRQDYLNKNGYKVVWDDTAKAPYIVDNKGNFFLSFDNALSIYYKGQYVLEHCLGGMFSWQSNMDNANILAAAMDLAVNDPVTLGENISNTYRHTKK